MPRDETPPDRPLGAARAGRPRAVASPGSGSAATTRSRTVAVSARRRRRSWPGCWPREHSPVVSPTRPGRCGTPRRSRDIPTTWRRRPTAGSCSRTRVRDGVAVVAGPGGPRPRGRGLHPAARPWRPRRRGRCCPNRVPHVDAAANAARAALLVRGHRRSDPDLLWEATRDWLHQEYRRAGHAEVVRADDRAARGRAGGGDQRRRADGAGARHGGPLAGLEEVPAPGFPLRRGGVGPARTLGDSEPLRESRAGVLAFHSRTRSADRGGRLVRVITAPALPAATRKAPRSGATRTSNPVNTRFASRRDGPRPQHHEQDTRGAQGSASVTRAQTGRSSSKEDT